MKKIVTHIVAGLSFITVSAFAAGLSPEVVANLSSEDMSVRTAAQNTLQQRAAEAGRPDAEAERRAFCKDVCGLLAAKPSPAAAGQLVRQLQRIGARESLPTLEGLLGHADPNLRDEARQALQMNAAPEAGRILLAALRKAQDPHWTAGLINALGQRRETGAVDQLASCLNHADSVVREAAVKALANTGGRDALSALYRARKDESDEALTVGLLDAAYFNLRQGEDQLARKVYVELSADTEAEWVRAAALRGLIVLQPRQSAALLNDALGGSSDEIRMMVVEAVGQARTPGLARILAAKLAGLPPPLQIQALGVLEDSGDRALAPMVVGLLASEEAGVSAAAAQALVDIGDAAAVPPLLQAVLAGGDLAREARWALTRLHAPGVAGSLQTLVADGSQEQQALALAILAERGDAEVEMLLRYAGDADRGISGAALKALENTAGLEQLPEVVDFMLANPTAPQARQALGVIVAVQGRSQDDGAIVTLLADAAAQADADGKALLFQALARVGGAQALVPVAAASDSGDATLRESAVRVLAEWPDGEALPFLASVVLDQQNALKLRVLALRGMTRLAGAKGGPETDARAELFAKTLVAAPRPEDRETVLGALAKLPSPVALKAVEPLVAEPALRAAAVNALLGIAGGLAFSQPDAVERVKKSLAGLDLPEDLRAKIAQLGQAVPLEEGWVVSWQVTGPYLGSDCFDREFPPEQGGAAEWRTVTDEDRMADNARIVNLNHSMGGNNRAAYLRTAFSGAGMEQARLEIGSDDGVKVWLNGELVHAKNASRPCRPGEDKVDVTLQAGVNQLLVKVTQGAADWSAVLRVVPR